MQKRKRSKASWVWTFITLSNDGKSAKCNHCDQTWALNETHAYFRTDSMGDHLSGRHNKTKADARLCSKWHRSAPLE